MKNNYLRSLLLSLIAALQRLFEATSSDVDKPVDDNPANVPDKPEPPILPNDKDDLDLSTVHWLGTPVSSAVPVTARITAASTDGGTILTSYGRYSWPMTTVKVPVDAICYLFYEQDGGIVGGKFDWWKTSGQPRKGLENVHTGYNGHRMPERGTKCWTMISSIDGKQRSNTCVVEWR